MLIVTSSFLIVCLDDPIANCALVVGSGLVAGLLHSRRHGIRTQVNLARLRYWTLLFRCFPLRVLSDFYTFVCFFLPELSNIIVSVVQKVSPLSSPA